MSAVSAVIPSPSCIPTSRSQGVLSLENGLARHSNGFDQSNDFHSSDSSIVCAVKERWGHMDRRIMRIDLSDSYVATN